MRFSLTAVLLFLMLAGCGGVHVGRGVVHTVGYGETFWRISKTYGVDLQEVAEINNIKDPTEIKAGSRIFIPRANRTRRVTPAVVPASVERGQDRQIVIEKGRFIWPVAGEVSSHFGVRNGAYHKGIDIRAPRGTPIRAADDGRAVHVASWMRDYGKLIILEHSGDFYTVYAHNNDNHVNEGDAVAKGQVIGTVGSTGNASGSHLHFEIRHGKNVRNPLFFLP